MKKQNQGGRPTLAELDIERVLIRTSLTLHEGEDDDLISWFNLVLTFSVAAEKTDNW